MNEQDVIDQFPVKQGHGFWLILECGHWYKWTGTGSRPASVSCPNCGTITVERPVKR